jgi:hypothetical protein
VTSRIAINVCDMSYFADPRQPINPAALLLQDFITKDSPTVQVNDQIDSGAVILDGPAVQDRKRVSGLVELLQTVWGPKKIGRRVRCYQEGPQGGWSEITTKSKVVL